MQKDSLYDFMHRTYITKPISYFLIRRDENPMLFSNGQLEQLEIIAFADKWEEFEAITKSYIKPGTNVSEYRENNVAYLRIN